MESLHQWRSQQHPDQHLPSAKAPKLHHLVDQQLLPSASSALALFATEPNSNNNITTPVMSVHPDSTPTTSPRMGLFFSVAQWQELELQALIYKYMLAGAPVPLELILHIRRSIPPHYHHSQQYQHFQLAMLQGGYWGRCASDPEPGRCRRTDGKKWRCSREAVTGQKYCERHVHRGRNRSRKHVEILPTPSDSSVLKSSSPFATTKESHFTLSGPSPMLEILPLNQRPPDGKEASGRSPQGLQTDKGTDDGRVLRSFFDDWPKTQQDLKLSNSNASSAATSTTQLSISISGNSSSDISLKLSTGDGSHPGSSKGIGRIQPSVGNWSMGGPLAEALRSSASTASPTSVLQNKPNGGSVSGTSSFST